MFLQTLEPIYHHTSEDAQGITPAAEVLAGTMGQSTSDGPNDALLRRMCEVASRRVARKRGVAVETPEAKIVEGALIVNLTYVDDGRCSTLQKIYLCLRTCDSD